MGTESKTVVIKIFKDATQDRNGGGLIADSTFNDKSKLQINASKIDKALHDNSFKFFCIGKGAGNNPQLIKVVTGSTAIVLKILKIV